MNITISDIIDLETLVESNQVEFKLAGGKDGNGALPKDFWPSYSAMANSRGGWIILGVKEKDGIFTPVGIPNSEKVKTDLFNQLNDRDKVSVNIISDDDVQTIRLQDQMVLAIRIQPAPRKQKPVHLKKTPFNNTYIRLHEGDRRCDDETVKRMLAEQIHDSRDSEILSEHYNFSDDIDVNSLKAYRNLLSSHNPQHPYLDLELFELFKKIGGWIKNRENGREGITLAGVLMFGTWEAINAAAPNYFVDYQERPEAKTELRWIDRIAPDGTWSGNLFDFYRRVYQKLITDIKVPFKLEDGQRKSDTPIHTALREALVNTIVHADFTDRVSILVVKRPDMFGFRNPGLMRIPLEDVIAGGTSDCRNRTLHQMFLLIGLGERAGSGMPKIFSGWKSVNWRTPKLWEKHPPQTLLELSKASLIPDDVRNNLHKLFQNRFEELNDFEQLIVATAAIEGWINHERACQLTTKHSREVTLTLPKLEQKGFLISNGEQKQKSYTLPGVTLPSPDEIFAPKITEYDLTSGTNIQSLTLNDQSLTLNDQSLTLNDQSLTPSGQSLTPSRDIKGRVIAEKLERPFIDDLKMLSPEFHEELNYLANKAQVKKRLPINEMEDIILNICQGQYVAISELAKLMNRSNQNIRQKYLKPLVDKGDLKMAFPQTPSTPKQGYTTTTKSNDSKS
ncbi:TPA: RNA-binding domain-containing protein [Photobacterium damselae]